MTDTTQGNGVSPTSILGQLAQRQEDIAREQKLTLAVPRWNDPEILVEYHLIHHETIRSRMAAIDKAKPADRGKTEVNANCDILIEACSAVWAVIDGQRYSLDPADPNGDPTKFDDRLAVNLGLDAAATARQVVRKLFFADGDIFTTAGSIMEFCGYQRASIEEVIAGE